MASRAIAELSVLARTSPAARNALIATLLRQDGSWAMIYWQKAAENCDATWIGPMLEQYSKAAGQFKLETLLYLLGSLGRDGAPAMGFLKDRLRTASAEDAAATRVVLAEIGDRSAENLAIIESNLARNDRVRSVTAVWLMAFGSSWTTPKMIGSLTAQLAATSTDDVIPAVLALGNQKDKARGAADKLAALIKRAEADDVPMLFTCRLALAQIQKEQRDTHLTKAMEIVGSDKFSNHPHMAAVFAAQRQLGRLRPDVVRLLDSTNMDVQAGAIYCMGVVALPQAELAIKLLKILDQPPTEQNERLRHRAAEVLAAVAEVPQLPQIEAARRRERQAQEDGNLAAIGVEMTLQSVIESIRLDPPKP